jgi:predicted NUDIX family phosphoesterase
MSKDNEMIMCVDKGRLFIGGMPTAQEVERATTSPGIAGVFRRGDVETDTALLQPIPYAVVIAPYGEEEEARVLVYKRTASGGETRLQDKYSLGVGGHINGVDIEAYFVNANEASPCTAGLFREMFEELGVDELNCEAILMDNEPIYDDSEDVSAVHIGLLYTVILSNTPELKVEDALTSIEWVTIDDIRPGTDLYDKLEGWSKIVAARLVKSIDEAQDESSDDA